MVVRGDLSPSQQAVQACHACLEAGKHFPWQDEHPHLALLVVPDENTLHQWVKRVQDNSLQTVQFLEPDLDNSLTAFAVPGVRTLADRLVFSGLPTLKLAIPTTKEKKMCTFQSKWGFHPCSIEPFRKLKRLNILAQKALTRMSAWERWDRKQPQNRRRFVGAKSDWEINTSGVIGQKKRDIPKMYRLYESVPEPVYPPIDREMIDLIAADYKNARTPVVESQVRPLFLGEQKLNSLLSLLEISLGADVANVPGPISDLMV